MKQSPSSLPASCLTVAESLQMCSLTLDERFAAWPLQEHERFPIPPLLVSIKEEHAFVTNGSPFNEALSRMTINDILITCIAEEKRSVLSGDQSGKTLAVPSCPSPSVGPSILTRPINPTGPDPAPLILQLGPKLSYVVEYRNEKWLLQGKADCSLWYNGNETMGTNFLLVETKRQGLLSAADGQLVAYMGVVHRTRETLKKTNHVVYGMSTDGNEFKFWRLDNLSQLTRSRIYDWNGGDGTKIISYVRLIVRAAIHASLSTSPVKDPNQRNVSLKVCHDSDETVSFEHGIGRLALGHEDYDEDEDLDILATGHEDYNEDLDILA